jgi:predicted nucleotidyltransferase
MIGEKGRFNRADALAIAEKVARKFCEPSPHLPKILEIIIFGSTSREGTSIVGDLDMVILTDPNYPKKRLSNLVDRLEQIEAELRREGAMHIPIDFLPLHVGYFTEPEIRTQYQKIMKDREHIDKILSDFLRWDPKSQSFKRANRAFLDSKYSL